MFNTNNFYKSGLTHFYLYMNNAVLFMEKLLIVAQKAIICK